MSPPPDSFSEWSYARHREHLVPFRAGEARAEEARGWMDDGTADAWRHRRMVALAGPLVESFPGSEWLTVGDGAYGRDAHHLAALGASVLATDLADELLAEARAAGYVERYGRENAECLSFADGAFDFVLCKEAYHHFPRPPLALYEMLRVARRGVMLVEPNDPTVARSVRELVYRRWKDRLKRLLGRDVSVHRFEETGNYVYALSRSEVEKLALAVGHRHVAFLGLNDSFLPGLGDERADSPGPALRRLKRRLALYDVLVRLGLMQPVLLAAIVFRTEPGPAATDALIRSGWDVVTLPANPYR